MADKLYVLYTITNNVNGLVYVGKTTKIKRFWKDHLQKAFVHDTDTWLYRDMRKYGVGAFHLDILVEGMDRETCNTEHIKYVASYRAVGKSYNMTAGGFGGDTSMTTRGGQRDISIDIETEVTGTQDERVRKVYGEDTKPLDFGTLFSKK